MTSSVTHSEIYGENPATLAAFYRAVLGWQVDKVPGIDYWRIDTATGVVKGIDGGLMFRPIQGPRRWVHSPRPVARANHRADSGTRRDGGATEGGCAEDRLVRRRGRPQGEHLRDLAGGPAGNAAAGTRRLSQKQLRRKETWTDDDHRGRPS